MCESLVQRAERNWGTGKSLMSLEWGRMKEDAGSGHTEPMRGQMSTFSGH